MNSIFNFPQNLSGVGGYLARSMFEGCSGASFKVNEEFRFPLLSEEVLNDSDVFCRTFADIGSNSPLLVRSAQSIINGNAIPQQARETFAGSDRFADRSSLHINWGGDSTSAKGLSRTGDGMPQVAVVFTLAAMLTVSLMACRRMIKTS